MVDMNNFNANEVDPAMDFEPIPADRYLAIITDSEEKVTKSGEGKYLQFTFQIIEGGYKNRNLWDRLNLSNKNETAVKIARGRLSSICRAVNVLKPKDSVELHNLPLILKVTQKKREDNGEMTNEIKAYYSKDTSKSEAAKETEAVVADAGPAPWDKK